MSWWCVVFATHPKGGVILEILGIHGGWGLSCVVLCVFQSLRGSEKLPILPECVFELLGSG